MAGAAALGVLALATGASRPGPGAGAGLVPRLDSALADLGLGIAEIRVAGHRHAFDNDIAAALLAGGRRSLALLDLAAARQRIEAIAWVDTARITRVLPGRVDVFVSERRPAALWRDGGRHHLVDLGGRLLAGVAATTAPELPRVAGAGAPAALAQLVAALDLHPGIRQRLEIATRIGERRWTLDLAGGVVAHLPEEGIAAALQAIADLDARDGVLGRPGTVVDVRVGGIVAVRSQTPRESGQAAAATGRRG